MFLDFASITFSLVCPPARSRHQASLKLVNSLLQQQKTARVTGGSSSQSKPLLRGRSSRPRAVKGAPGSRGRHRASLRLVRARLQQQRAARQQLEEELGVAFPVEEGLGIADYDQDLNVEEDLGVAFDAPVVTTSETPVFRNFASAQAGTGDPMAPVTGLEEEIGVVFDVAEPDNSVTSEPDFVFPDYETALVGSGDPMEPVSPIKPTVSEEPGNDVKTAPEDQSDPSVAVNPMDQDTRKSLEPAEATDSIDGVESSGDVDPRVQTTREDSTPPSQDEDIVPRVVNMPDTTTPQDDSFVFPEAPVQGEVPASSAPAPTTRRPDTTPRTPSRRPGDPLSLSYCLPLSDPGCGLLAAPSLTEGLIEHVEEGNVRTDQISAFLDTALESALSSMGPVQVLLEAGDLVAEGGGRGGGQVLAGGQGCSDGAVLGSWWVEARSTGEAVLQSRGNLQVRGWLQGAVSGRAQVKADLWATYRRKAFKCLTVTQTSQEATAELGGSLGVGVRLAAREVRLDYRTRDEAELHFVVGLQVAVVWWATSSVRYDMRWYHYPAGLRGAHWTDGRGRH